AILEFPPDFQCSARLGPSRQLALVPRRSVMDVLTILFAGLIAHVMTDSGAQRAVLVAAPAHEARLIVDAADVIENRGFERDARGAFKLEGEHVTIDGIPQGDAMFEASYLRNVPSLTRISDGTTVIPEIETASPSEAVSAYVDLGRGVLSANDTVGRVTFDHSRSMCLAGTIEFRAETDGEVAFRTVSGKVLRVIGNATVRIVNDPPLGAAESHFHMFAKLLTDATRVDEPAMTGACGARRRVASHSIMNGCVGSQ